MTRAKKRIVVHCTATQQHEHLMPLYVDWILHRRWRKAEGYHKIVFPDGTITTLAGDDVVVNGAVGYNPDSLHVAYMGGRERDDRTEEQKKALTRIILEWQQEYGIPDEKVVPHYALNPNKACPWYDPRHEMNPIGDMRRIQQQLIKQIDAIMPLHKKNRSQQFNILPKCREEIIELLFEISRILDKGRESHNINKEIADVIITVTQLYLDRQDVSGVSDVSVEKVVEGILERQSGDYKKEQT